MDYELSKFPWQLKKVGLPGIWNQLDNRGKAVRIGIIDTGFDVNHPELLSASVEEKKFASSNPDPVHGTACLGVMAAQGKEIFGICPDADYFAASVADEQKNYSIDSIIEAIQWLVFEKNVQVVSVSLIVLYSRKQAVPPEKIAQLQRIISQCFERGVLIISTIGDMEDDGSSPIYSYPGLCEHVVCVGGYNQQQSIRKYTSVFSKLDILAPSDDLAVLDQITAKYKTHSGVSYAVPLVAGFLALIMAARSCTSAVAMEFLKSNIQSELKSNRNNKLFRQLSSNLNL